MNANGGALKAAPADKLSIGTMIRYGAGQTGAQIFRDTPAVLMPVFMSTMLGVPPWLAGLAILIPKLWVMVCDPVMGLYSDKLKSRMGRTPFLFAGGLASALAFMALFAVTDYPSPTIAAIAICVIYTIGITGFSAFSVPYLAVASELSADPHERTKLLAFRIIFTSIGVILGVGFAQPIIRHFGNGVEGWHAMSFIFAAVIAVSMLTPALGLRKTPLIGKTGGEAAGLKEQFAEARRNKPFLILTFVHFVQSIAQACTYTAVGLVFLYIVGDVGLLPAFTFAMCLCGLSSQPLWVWLSRRFGKLAIFVVSSIGFALITASWLFIGSAGETVVQVPFYGEARLEVVQILLRAAGCGILNQGFLLIVTSMFTDTVEHGRRVNGAENAGGLAGFWSASEKVAFALGPFIGGLVLSASGFVASKGGIVPQSEQAIQGIIWLFSIIPAVIFVISLPLLWAYKPKVGQD